MITAGLLNLGDVHGSPRSAPVVVWGNSGGSPGAPLSAAGLLWGTCLSALGGGVDRFGMIFAAPGGVGDERNENLGFDDPLIQFALFLGSDVFTN